MAIDAKTIGAFGVSFSRGLDQAWVNLWRKEDGFLVEFFQNFEDMESDEEDEILDEDNRISFDLGEEIIRRALEKGGLESWPPQYTDAEKGRTTDLNWTIDVDDNDGADLLLLSGNGLLPPEGQMEAVIEAVRLCENRFMRCTPEFR